MTFNIGQPLRGYVIREFVQAGGFGAVYKAYQDSIYRDVAIKVIENDRIVKSVDFIRRFEIEAQIIARLEHPHIVPIYDFWREPDRAFIVMRWLDSGSIRSQFTANAYFDGKTVSTLISHIGSALHFVHQRGIVHRDIKPDNILVDRDDNYYLTDFGIAIEMQHSADVDVEFLRIGTPEYMSPEQILYDTVTYKSDIYAFAILIYEILTHETPFMGDNTDAILIQHVNVPFPSIQKIRPDLPHELDTVFAKATEKSPDDRYDSMLEFVQDLIPLINESTLPPITVQPNAVSMIPTDTIAFSEKSTNTIVFSEKSTDTIAFVDKSTATRVFENATMINRNPYKGLKAFDETDASDFFGRNAICRQMVSLLQKQLEQEQSSFMAVIGASGSGKSSVVRAGLIPSLRSGELNGSDNWFYITMIPGDNPIITFAEKLNSIAIQGQDDFVDVLRTNAFDVVQMIGDMVGQERIFLLIDQFEEVFTQVEDEAEHKNFIDLLVRLSKSDLGIVIVITLRADFYDKPLAYRALGELIQQSTVTVLPMSSDELVQVILAPAKSVNCEVQPSLVSQLIADTIHQPNALPLLQFTITELFGNRDGNVLTLGAYESMGRLHGSIAQRAETVYLSLSAREQDITQRLFLQLVILSDTNKTVRRRILWKDALQIAQRADIELVINLFGDNRLLTFDRDLMSRQPTLEVAHEALIQAWTRLQIWIAENRTALMTYNRLVSSVSEWLDNEQDRSFLVRDVHLLQYEGILQNSIINLNHDQQQYMLRSQALRRRTQLLRYGVIFSLIVLTIASIVVSLVAIDKQNQANLAEQVALGERDRANKESGISQSRALAATSLNARASGRDALLMAVEANMIADTFEARDSLANILTDHQWVERYYSQDVPIRDFAISSDSQWVYSVGDSSNILQWDLHTSNYEILAELESIPILNTIMFNTDETLLAVGGEGGYALLDTATGEILYDVNRDADVWSVTWALDDNIIYGVDSLGAVFAFDIGTGETLFDVTISSEALFGMALHSDGNMLAVGGANSIINVLDILSGDVIYEFEGHSNWVLSLAYSPDGKLLASGGADLNLIVWDLDNLQALGQIPTRHTDWIRHIEFNSGVATLCFRLMQQHSS
jgi:serine/threonine protein kinase